MKKTLKIVGFLVLIALIVLAANAYKRLHIISGYSAKSVCSCVFTADRPFEAAQSDLDFFPASLAKSEINEAEKSVTSSVFGLRKKTAIYSEGLGCALLHSEQPNKRSLQLGPFMPPPDTLWPYGIKENWPSPSIKNAEKLQEAFDFAFLPEHKTRALLVIKDDAIIKEQYAEGFDKYTPQTGWSMTKAIAATLVGILNKQGKIEIDQAVDIPAWKEDERSKITMRHLLAMGSGLEWEEDYFGNSDVNQMLWNRSDSYKISVDQPLEFEPGTVREYSSGTSNLISGYLRKILKNDQTYWALPYKELLRKIGMNSAEMETDEVGNYVMSSHCYASARDWAKFGLLYLHKGNWNGEQIIEEKWVESAVTPDKNDPAYGWVFVLNTRNELFADAPKDTYLAGGFNGQKVIVIPSENMVIVRLGVSDEFDCNRVVRDVLDSFY